MPSSVKLILRSLLKSPGFTAVAVLTLALCIGANVAIFSVVDAILLRPLPFPEPDRLIVATDSYPGSGNERVGASLVSYYERREAIKAFSTVSLYQPGSAVVGEAGSPRSMPRDRVSPEFFATLGVPLAMGRAFNEDETLPAGSRVAVLTDSFWRTEFNADAHVLGRTFQVDAQPVTIIGVLPPGFRYLSSKARFFTPIASDPEFRRGPRGRYTGLYQFIARLAPGVTLSAAQSQVNAFVKAQTEELSFANELKAAGYRTDVYLLHADHVREVRPVLLILQAGGLFLLLIAGANLVNLLLIRAHARQKDLAIRQALGAHQWHVARQVTLETLLLAISGGLFGLVFGALGIRLLTALGTNELPLGADIALDGSVMAVAIAVSFVVGIALAMPVLAYSLRTWLAPALQSGARSGTASRAAQRMRNSFVVAQVALTFVLLSGAGLLGLSLQRVLEIAPGFRPDHVLTGQLTLPEQNYPKSESRLAFVERLLGDIGSQPGVTAAGVTTALPMSNMPTNASIVVMEGIEPQPGEAPRAHNFSAATAGYFKALGIPLRLGRLLEDADNYREQKVCVIDEALARRYWPGQSPLGRRLAIGSSLREDRALTVVGVVGSVKQGGLAEREAKGMIYLPYRKDGFLRGIGGDQFFITLRTTMNPERPAALLRKTVARIDPQLPVDSIKPMRTWIDESLVSRRSPALLAAIFAGVALLLAAIGTYGVLAYAVSQRRREIGIRMAIGAQPRQVLTQFLGMSAKLLLAGLVLGVLGAWLTGRTMQGVLFGVSAFHAGILLATAAVMTLVTVLATFLPSRRASRVDPLVALQAE